MAPKKAAPKAVKKTPLLARAAQAASAETTPKYDIAKLSAMSHGISIGKEAGLDEKTWIPHVLMVMGGYTREEAKSFFPQGSYPEPVVKAPCGDPTPEAAPAETADVGTTL